MRCKYCNVEIKGKADVCPLCHQKINDSENETREYLYPTRKQRMIQKQFSFTTIYCFIIACLNVIFITVNMIATPDILWFLLLDLGFFYIYILVHNTILHRSSGAYKIFMQSITLCALALLAQWIAGGNWAYDYAFPLLLLLSLIVMLIFLCVKTKRPNEYIFYIVMLSLLGFIPMILFWCGVTAIVWPAATVGTLSIMLVIGILFFAPKEFLFELKKKFHF